MSHHVAVGETIELRCRFWDQDGVATDPTTVTLTITAPDGTVDTPAATNDPGATGLFTYNLPITDAGVWTVNWEGSGAVSAIFEDRFIAGPHRNLGPCEPWASAEDLFRCTNIAEEDRDWPMAISSAEAASELLFWRTGRRYAGFCEATVRPCRRSTSWGYVSGWLDTWQTSWGWCSCQAPESRSCGCPSLDQITLGGEPLQAIIAVRVDGELLDPSLYRIDDDRWLSRLDGNGWPCCQDLTADPASEIDTFEVEYLYGQEPPEAGKRAAQRLGAELYAACSGGACRLPKRLETLTRNGVQMGFLDPFEFFERGQTGVYEVDLFISQHDYLARRGPAMVAGPHVDRRVRRAGV